MEERNSKFELSFVGAFIHRMVLPIFLLLFGIAYFLNTYGRIPWDSLRYPYLFLSILLLSAITITLEELYGLYKEKDKYSGSTTKALHQTFYRWKSSIYFVLFTIVFLVLIGLLGFVPAMAVYLIGGMRLAGLRDWKRVILYSGVIWVITYVLFIQLLDIYFPPGPLGI